MIFYGAGGHAKVVVEAWQAAGGEASAVVDDNSEIKTLLDFSVTHPSTISKFSFNTPVIVSVGSNVTRKRISMSISNHFGTVLHPSAIISTSARIQEGSVVFAGAIVNAVSQIGKHCIVNTGAKIDHDCVLNDFVHVAPGATICGGVTIGEGTLVGAGAVILPLKKIGEWSVVGAGAVVIEDVPPFSMVVGNPAKVIRTITHE
jgi:sugar O-acyltransferase (sialic acid O-acetyltransferase NeuD family)